VLDSLRWFEACRSNFRRSPRLAACSMVVSMPLSEGLKRIQEVRPQAMNNLRALDRHPQRLIFGYATNPLAAEKAALKAAREAAEAARPKKRRKEKTSPTCETTALPRDASQVCDATMRAFLQPLHASAANAPACAQAPPTQQSPLPPIPVALAPES
jgi:hypothetical protein